MRKFGWIILILVSVGVSAQETKEKHVILISIDGFRPEFYLDTLWKAPTLQRLMKEGVYAEGMKPVYPSVTYPNHISMITGTLPNKHGIYYNKPINGQGLWNSSMIKTPTVFDAVHASGRTTSALFWPVMAESAIQYNVPSSPGVKAKMLPGFMNQKASPGLWNELQQHALDNAPIGEVKNDKNTGKMAAYIIKTYKPALVAVRFAGIDHAMHKVGTRDRSIAKALLTVDQAIDRILQTIEDAGMTENTTVLIVGDHGFCDVHTSLSPNVWLKKKRLIKSEYNWKARFFTANGSAFLYLKDPDDDRTLRRVKRILENLPEREQKLFNIIDKEELDKLGADPHAMLALNPIEGIVFRQTGSGKTVKHTTGGGHGYLADFPGIMTGFVGWGSGLKPGTVIHQMNVPDIAPIITRLLNVDFISADGTVIEEMFLQH